LSHITKNNLYKSYTCLGLQTIMRDSPTTVRHSLVAKEPHFETNSSILHPNTGNNNHSSWNPSAISVRDHDLYPWTFASSLRSLYASTLYGMRWDADQCEALFFIYISSINSTVLLLQFRFIWVENINNVGLRPLLNWI
jgi:sugar (pentulose or hexulose) kinase